MDKVIITAGRYRGRGILTPGGATHPMGSRERLALFNILGGRVTGARVLDAFAGSGALGIEALSRGARDVVFVENNARAAGVIRENLHTLGLDATVMQGRVSSVAPELGQLEVILADPPYDNFSLTEVASLVPALADGGMLVLSHPGEPPALEGLTLKKTRQYAAAHLSFYTKQ